MSLEGISRMDGHMNQENGSKNSPKGDNFKNYTSVSYSRGAVEHSGLLRATLKNDSEVVKLKTL